MELTIPPLIRMPHPLRKLRRRHDDVDATTATVTPPPVIPKQRTSTERTLDQLISRG